MKKIKNYLWQFKKKFFNSKFIRIISDFYEERANKIPDNNLTETKNGWSIVVVTSGKANESLSKLVKSAENELLNSPGEVIIVGPQSSQLNFIPKIKVRYLIYKELGLAPGWITKKKNLGVKMAVYDKVAVCHDYVVFQTGWKKGFDIFGNDFDVCVNKIINFDGTRFRDWIAWDYPEVGPGLLPYHIECTQYQIISGTFFVVKRNFYLENLLDEKIRWGEGEDAEWSLRIRKKTKFKLNLLSSVTFSKNKIGVHGSWIDNTEKLEKILQLKN